LADTLRAVSADADKTRMAMQQENDAAKKAVKDKREEIKKRGLPRSQCLKCTSGLDHFR
jgi:hypothetical protein